MYLRKFATYLFALFMVYSVVTAFDAVVDAVITEAMAACIFYLKT